MSGHHRVDLDELQTVMSQLQAFEDKMRMAMRSVESQVNELHTTWTGDAATAHWSAHERWREGTAKMTDALATMHRIATTAHGNYSAAVTANQQMWRL